MSRLSRLPHTFYERESPEDAALDYPKDGKNGPNTQGYIESVMHDMHIEDYIMTPEEDDDKMLVQMGAYSVKPSHYRKTMAENTGYEFGTNEGLVQHMKETCTVELDKDGNVVKNKHGSTVNMPTSSIARALKTTRYDIERKQEEMKINLEEKIVEAGLSLKYLKDNFNF